jgi:hypothetical protein
MTYAEDHCALNWPMMTTGLYAPVLAVVLAIVAVVVGAPGFLWPVLAFLIVTTVAWAVAGAWLKYVWPTGIRLDGDGVRIGGVRWAERHPGRTRDRLAIVPRQYSQVFECPWDGVRRIGVITDPKAIKAFKKNAHRGLKPSPLGNLAVPFMRAALVILVDGELARVPGIRRRPSLAWRLSGYTSPGYNQPLWVVPTRRPGDVASALARLGLTSRAASGADDLLSADADGAALSDARGRALRGSHAALQGEHQQHERDDPGEDHDGHVRRQHEAQ